MSRIAKAPIQLPKGVEVKLDGRKVSVKGPKGELSLDLHESVGLEQEGETVTMKPQNEKALGMTGTMRALVNNMVSGVSEGFERRLNLVGVGYRAQAQGTKLNLNLGFSHPVEFEALKGIALETPSQTEIVVKGADKQQVGQVAAQIRAFRSPEPYKGKGIRYSDERISLKEAKKK